MEKIYLNNPEPDDFFEGPSDDDLEKIEQEIQKYVD